MDEMTFNVYQGASLMSLVIAGCVEVFSPSNPSNEREILKG